MLHIRVVDGVAAADAEDGVGEEEVGMEGVEGEVGMQDDVGCGRNGLGVVVVPVRSEEGRF